jgi:hypothetical protein
MYVPIGVDNTTNHLGKASHTEGEGAAQRINIQIRRRKSRRTGKGQLPGRRREIYGTCSALWWSLLLFLFLLPLCRASSAERLSQGMSKGQKKTAAGIAFPLDGKATRSSTNAGKAVWIRAANSVPGGEELATQIESERDWRHGYVPHIVNLTRLSLKSPTNALTVARNGLAALHETFEYIPSGSDAGIPLPEAMKSPNTCKFHTGIFKGSGSATGLQVPLGDTVLSGPDLDSKVDAWVEYGCLEADAAAAIKAVNAEPAKASLHDHCFVMIGVGSEMGPLRTLMQMGATVVGTGTRRSAKWTRVFDMVRDTPGKLLLPISQPQGDMTEQQLAEAAGCDLTEDVPELLAWIKAETLNFKRITLGCYVYMDGEAHVRAALAMDLIAVALVDAGKEPTNPLAFHERRVCVYVCVLVLNCAGDTSSPSLWWTQVMKYESFNAIVIHLRMKSYFISRQGLRQGCLCRLSRLAVYLLRHPQRLLRRHGEGAWGPAIIEPLDLRPKTLCPIS